MDIIERAVTVLSHDGLVIYPTDTLYGLGADAFSIEAIEKVYDAKKRDLAKPNLNRGLGFRDACRSLPHRCTHAGVHRTVSARAGHRGSPGTQNHPLKS